jgi:hypothetical protein
MHKAQESTYNQVAISLSKDIDRSCLYVACSRVTNSSGLYILGEFRPPVPPLPNHLACTEMSRPKCPKGLHLVLKSYSLVVTIKSAPSVTTTLVYNDIHYSVPFVTL